MKDYYSILGIKPGASKKEIRDAYHARIRVVHPDRFDQKTQPAEWQKANEMMAEINEAYSELKDSAEQDVEKPGAAAEPESRSCTYSMRMTPHETIFHDLPIETQSLLIKEISHGKGSCFTVKTDYVARNYVFLATSICWFVFLFQFPETRLGLESEFILATIIASLSVAYNAEKIYKWHTSSINSYFMLTPLYFIDIKFDVVRYAPIRLLKDISLKRKFRRGSDGGTKVKLIFEGWQVKLYISSMNKMEKFSSMYENFIKNLKYESIHGNNSYITDKDIFVGSGGKPFRRRIRYTGLMIYIIALSLGISVFFVTKPSYSQISPVLLTYNPSSFQVRSPEILPAEKPLPRNGWSRDFFKDSPIVPLTIKNPFNQKSFLVKICDWKTNKDIKIIFVRAGENVKARVPIGSYRFKFTCGSKWYGADYAFGNTRFECLKKKLACSREGDVITGYVVDLDDLPPNGNLDVQNINREDF